MLSRKNVYIIIGVVVALVVYSVYSWYITSSQEQPSGGNIEEGPTNNSGGEEPKGGLIICRDLCGDGICLSSACTNDMNCPCSETPEDCPQDCGQ